MTKYGGEEESLSFTYDVFLSFRGEDTRHNFIGHLRKELGRKGINTFVDDKDLRIGEDISPSLSNAIEESKILIIVFSKNYATSTWCLNELVKILECKERNNKQLIFPIFYHVDPSDIRHQRNSYGEAMIAHENRFGKDSQKVKAWRSALSEATNLPGKHISTGYEINFIEEIAEKVYKNIAPKPLHNGHNPVGLEPYIEKVKSLLDMKPNDKRVRMLGIYGLGGIGKTELAKGLYDNIVHQFEAASFLAHVREKSSKIHGVEDLQRTLLSEMFEELETELGSATRGIYEIKRKLCRKKVLLVLDDVDDDDRLEKLAGGCDWFGPGSRIIITTRDKDLLIARQVEKIYKMTELNDEHALELFCRNAFKQNHPKTGYEDVSLRAVSYAKGLPLALKVIGSDLATFDGESLDDWEDALKEYEVIPNKRIQDVLKISYDRLGKESNAQKVFLDIACFFKGKRIEYVKTILKEFHATYSIKLLVNKSLLTIERDCLQMHDLIQDMGREIVRQEAKNPGKRSRLWSYEDVIEVLTEDSGSDSIEGIMLDPPQQQEVEWSGTAFKLMKWLRILIVRNTSFSSEPKYLPNHLRVLDWEEYPSKSFPPEFNPLKIIALNLPNSHLTLEKPFKKFSSLTNMNFSRNQSITEMPDVSEVQNLRELRLDKCRNLIAVHKSIGFLKWLARLSASECTKLNKFLRTMFLPSLEVLDLNFCVRLEHFPKIEKQMNKPLKIYMINTAIKELPDSISNLTGLVQIEMPSSRRLKYLPSTFFMLPNVVAFKIGGCYQLREFFRSFVQSSSASIVHPPLRTLYFGHGDLSDEDLFAVLNCFPKLEELIASENCFVSLPTCIKECVRLTSLDVSFCRKLRKIPECTSLRILSVHHCVRLEEISELPSTIQKVDARYCFSLSRETSDMLQLQVAKERDGLEVVMPQTEIPEWFDYIGIGGNPHFWARAKFPIIALALVFQDKLTRRSQRELVDLHLIINGQCVPRKGYYNFRIAADHVLICDLRVLFSDKEWHGLDAFLEHDWNLVQVSYEATSTLTLSCWGLFVYNNQGTNMEDVQFMCPDPKYSDIANMSSTVAPTKDPKQKQIKIIDQNCLDEMFDRYLMEIMDFEERYDFADKKFDTEQTNILMGGVKVISEQAKDVLESSRACGEGSSSVLEDRNSLLSWFLDPTKETDNDNKVDVGEASTSGYQRSDLEEEYDKDPQQKIMTEIYFDGMTDGLLEAQNSFPSLDIIKTRYDALEKGRNAQYLPGGERSLPIEHKIYTEGIIDGLYEAKLSFPDLDMWAILNTILSRKRLGSFIPIPDLDWTTVVVPPSSDDPLLQAFMMMRQENVESEATSSNPFWKLKEEHKALQKKFEQLEDDITPDKATCFPSSKNEYDELIEKFNTQSDELVLSKKNQNLGGANELKSALSRGEIHTDNFGHQCVTKLGAVLKGRAEELRRLHDAATEGFQNSEDFQDLMSATYLDGLRDGLLEAQAIILSLNMETIIPVSEENEECVIDEAAKEEHVEVVNNENLSGAIGVTDIPSTIGPDDTDTPYKATCFPSLKREYDELIEKFNTQFAEFILSKKNQTSSSGQGHTDNIGCKCVTKVGTDLKGLAAELQRLLNAAIEGFQNSEQFQDLMSAIYLNGLRDGLLEAQAILLAPNMETTNNSSV